jgi:hypothetical protein
MNSWEATSASRFSSEKKRPRPKRQFSRPNPKNSERHR